MPISQFRILFIIEFDMWPLTCLTQDANECWVQMVRLLQQKIPGEKPALEESSTEGATAEENKQGFVDQYFSVQFDTTYP